MSLRNRFYALLLCAVVALGTTFLPASVRAQQVLISYHDFVGNFNYGRVDLSTGIVTFIAFENDFIFGLATTPNGTVYATSPNFFGTLDPVTGNLTTISNSVWGYNLAANSNTSLFSLTDPAEAGTTLYSFDTTGSVTTIGSDPGGAFQTGYDSGDLAFGPNGKLYYLTDSASFFGGQNGLYTVDPTTGAKTFVFDPTTTFAGAAMGGLVYVNGALYAFVNDTSGEAPTQIVQIDPVLMTVTPGAFIGDGVVVFNGVQVDAATTQPTPAVSYVIVALYDQTRAVKKGATIPIKLQVNNAAGVDVSSASLVAHAVSVTLVSTNAPGVLEDAGNANPDNDFHFDATVGTAGGYIFNLKTTGLGTGTWNLNFTVGTDPKIYSVQFQIK